MTDSSSLIRIIQSVQPDEIYNLVLKATCKSSFDVPEYTAEAGAVGTLRMLGGTYVGLEKKTKIYQASALNFSDWCRKFLRKRELLLSSRSPYGVAKQYGFWITRITMKAMAYLP